MTTSICINWNHENQHVPATSWAKTTLQAWSQTEEKNKDVGGKQIKFNASSWNEIGINHTIMKVYSHQNENANLCSPNLFCVNANNTADKATKIILKINQRWKEALPKAGNTRITIPPF
jgi:hypothetical protein